MSTSYIINLTAEGEHEEMSVFIENLLGTDHKFTPAVLERFLNFKIESAWGDDTSSHFRQTKHTFNGTTIKGEMTRALLIDNGSMMNYDLEDLNFYVFCLSISFPKIRFRLYGDNYQWSAYMIAYECGFAISCFEIKDDEYFNFDIREKSDNSQVIDMDSIKNLLDDRFNNQHPSEREIISGVDQNTDISLTLIQKLNYGRDLSDLLTKEILGIQFKKITNTHRLMALIRTLYFIDHEFNEETVVDTESTFDQQVLEFINRLKHLI